MKQHWKNLSENLKLSEQSRERIHAQLASLPIQREVVSTRRKPVRLRAPLVAAALAGVLVVTALAVELAVGWESFLGRTPKEAITPVGVSAVTGDYTLTLQESIVDDDGAAFLLALTRNDGGVLEGEPNLWGNNYYASAEVEGNFPNGSSGRFDPIFSEDRKTVYYCMDMERYGGAESLAGKTITFQCDGVVDTDWSEEELAMTVETVSLAPLAQAARQVDMSYADICKGQNAQAIMEIVGELSAQATIPLTRIDPKYGQVSAVFFSSDGCPVVAVKDWNSTVLQGHYLIGYGIATTLTDVRTGEQWEYKSSTKRGKPGNEVQLAVFNGCPLTLEDLPYVEVTVSYSMDKILSDEPVELSFVAGDGYQTTVALDEDIAFNYIGDCTAHMTGASISALRLELTFDQLERSGWDWENHPQKNTQWALVNKDGNRVLLFPPMIRQDEETGTGYIRLEGVDENDGRRLIDPGQVAGLLVGDTLISLK